MKRKKGPQTKVSQGHRQPGKGLNAFTLIELLIVIAIIAILAAILFPVFAQAKKSAKASAALSNAKQVGIAHIMYAGDYDDTAMMGGVWNSPDPDALQTGSTAGYLPWPALAESYTKNLDLFLTPFAPRTEPFISTPQNQCNGVRSCTIRYPQFGYNMMYLAPWISQGGVFTPSPISYTSIAKPAQQVVLTELWTRSTCPRANTWGTVQNSGYVTMGEAPPPDKKNSLSYGYVMPTWGHGWGRDANALAFGTIPSLEEGKYTGGVAFRAMQKTSVLFADGHVQRMGPDKLAEGTNWSLATKEMPSFTISNLRDGKYMWHPEGL